jgi:chromate reductase
VPLFVSVYNVMPELSTSTDPRLVIPVFTTASDDAVGVAPFVVGLVADGCAPTFAFAPDEPHALSAITAAVAASVKEILPYRVFMRIATVRLRLVCAAPDTARCIWIRREAAVGSRSPAGIPAPAKPLHRRMAQESEPVVEVLFVSGSLQRVSANRALLAAAARFAEGVARTSTFDGIADLPHFNPDLDDHDIPALAEWRAAIAQSDGIVIATPEYAHSLPGTLKNALDWIVGSGELYDKPVALMSAGTSGGQRALDALAQTLRAQGAKVDAQLSVPGIRPKLDGNGDLADAATIEQVSALVRNLVDAARVARAASRNDQPRR